MKQGHWIHIAHEKVPGQILIVSFRRFSRLHSIRWRDRESSKCSFLNPGLNVYFILCSPSSSARGTILAQKMFRSFIHAIISSLLLRSAMFAGVSPATAGVSFTIRGGEENISWDIELAWDEEEDSVSTFQRWSSCKGDVLVTATYCCSRAGWHHPCEEPSSSPCLGCELRSGQACHPIW